MEGMQGCRSAWVQWVVGETKGKLEQDIKKLHEVGGRSGRGAAGHRKSRNDLPEQLVTSRMISPLICL